MRISVIGSGVVGEATGTGLHMKGNQVMFYDIDKRKLDALEKRGYMVCSTVASTVQNSDVIFICVPTPTIYGKMDLSSLEKVTMNVAKALSKNDGYKVVVVRSTVLPSTTRCKVIPLLQLYSSAKLGKDFGVCANPEFLREKHALRDFLNPSRIVIGESDRKSGEILEKVYTVFDAQVVRTDLDTAEMIKYVSNLFLASKISFFNEIYIICCELGLNAHLISEAVSLDPRIGNYGIYGGKPFEGKCFPKDLEAFIEYVKARKIDPRLLEATSLVNKEIVSYASRNLKNKRSKRQHDQVER